MNVTNLGILSTDSSALVKFIVIDNQILLFGKVLWHKDLARAASVSQDCTVTGAGVIPCTISSAGIDDTSWGGWKSTGFNIVTEEGLRAGIRESLLTYEEEIKALYQ